MVGAEMVRIMDGWDLFILAIRLCVVVGGARNFGSLDCGGMPVSDIVYFDGCWGCNCGGEG